jgi:hypothetical protein
MSRIAEVIPEQWLRRKGFFTQRGLKVLKEDGWGEIDILAFNPKTGERVHLEVSASIDPGGFYGGGTVATLAEGVAEEVDKKYKRPNIERVRDEVCPPAKEGQRWKFMLTHGKLKREEEVRAALIDNHDVEPVSLFTMISEMGAEELPYRAETDGDYFAALAYQHAARQCGPESDSVKSKA